MGITEAQEMELVAAYGAQYEGSATWGWAEGIEAEEVWVELDRKLAGPLAKEQLKPKSYYQTSEGELYEGEALIDLAEQGYCSRKDIEYANELTKEEREEMYGLVP
jgi:hypothetical protein